MQYIERTRDPTAALKVLPDTVGFCVDHAPDKVVGVAAEGLLVGSQDVAYDKELLQSLEVTHILNVGFQLQNAFPQVRYLESVRPTFCSVGMSVIEHAVLTCVDCCSRV